MHKRAELMGTESRLETNSQQTQQKTEKKLKTDGQRLQENYEQSCSTIQYSRSLRSQVYTLWMTKPFMLTHYHLLKLHSSKQKAEEKPAVYRTHPDHLLNPKPFLNS